jgi:hypothetical protein
MTGFLSESYGRYSTSKLDISILWSSHGPRPLLVLFVKNPWNFGILKNSVWKWPWILKPHCIRCSHFKVDDISALEPSSKLLVHIVEDNVAVTASATYAMTLVMAWMLWRRNVDLLVPAGTSTRLDWIQCGFNVKCWGAPSFTRSWIHPSKLY